MIDIFLTSAEIAKKIREVALNERKFLAQLLEYLIIMDERKLYLELGFSSLFDFVLKQLHFSEHETYLRIHAARTLRKFPEIKPFIASGEINLTLVKLISPHLNTENQSDMIASCKGKTAKQVEAYLKRDRPQDPVKPSFPQPHPKLEQPVPKDTSSPVLFSGEDPGEIPPKKLKIKKFIAEINDDEESLLGEIKNILSLKYPKGASETQILQELMKFYISKKSLMQPSKSKNKVFQETPQGKISEKVVEKTKVNKQFNLPKSSFPEKTPRIKIPMSTKRQVWTRDLGQCQFVADDGTPCHCSWRCEIDHIIPLALGGTNDLSNLRLLCRNHNVYMAEVKLGKHIMDRFKKVQTRFEARVS